MDRRLRHGPNVKDCSTHSHLHTVHSSRYSVGRITTQASAREMATADFELKVKQFFPHDGSDM